MSAIHAIFEKGVFRPVNPVDLPEKTHVVFEPRVVNSTGTPTGNGMSKIYEVLSRSYDTDHPDLAERHDEHQP